MPTFSLIIPVYNVEKYLADCLDSCINQTFIDIEIICINDCSPDESGKILEKYAKKDSRIKVINHETNKYQGGARNTGIEAATGNYLWFVDSDDIILCDACDFLFSVINKTHAEIIRFNMINFNHDDIHRLGIYERMEACRWPYNKIIKKDEYVKLETTEITVCTFIAIASHLKKFRFRESVFHEDSDFVPKLFSEAESIYCINTALYFRRLHNKSVTGGGISAQKRIFYKLYAVDSLTNYIVSSKLPKSHFCVKIIKDDIRHCESEYNKYPEIHNKEFDQIILRAKKLGSVFSGDPRLYENIIARYGNTWFLEFILKVYNFTFKYLSKLK